LHYGHTSEQGHFQNQATFSTPRRKIASVIGEQQLMSITPTNIQIEDSKALVIDWSDGTRRRYTFRQLRDACPCASCREKHRGSPKKENPLQVVSLAETKPMSIVAMQPVGNYAYSIHFSDGHDTGIFTLEQLQELGEKLS